MEGVAETGFLTLFGGERLDGLQVEVEIQMQVVEILAVNQEIQHVVALDGRRKNKSLTGTFHRLKPKQNLMTKTKILRQSSFYDRKAGLTQVSPLCAAVMLKAFKKKYSF